MYSHQRGILPGFAWLLGCLVLLAPCYGILVVLPNIAAEINKQPNLSSMLFFIVQFMLQAIAFLGFAMYLALFCFKLFPSLSITREGLICSYVPGVFTDFFKWSEIQRIYIRGNYVFLILFRPGIPLFNRLHINSLYGRAFKVGVGSPILLLSPYLTNRDAIVEEVQKKCVL